MDLPEIKMLFLLYNTENQSLYEQNMRKGPSKLNLVQGR